MFEPTIRTRQQSFHRNSPNSSLDFLREFLRARFSECRCRHDLFPWDFSICLVSNVSLELPARNLWQTSTAAAEDEEDQEDDGDHSDQDEFACSCGLRLRRNPRSHNWSVGQGRRYHQPPPAAHIIRIVAHNHLVAWIRKEMQGNSNLLFLFWLEIKPW